MKFSRATNFNHRKDISTRRLLASPAKHDFIFFVVSLEDNGTKEELFRTMFGGSGGNRTGKQKKRKREIAPSYSVPSQHIHAKIHFAIPSGQPF